MSLGSLVAWELGLLFIPLRKPDKLSYDVQSVSYDLEYGSAALEATVEACAFVIELDFLKGREKLEGYEVHSLLHY